MKLIFSSDHLFKYYQKSNIKANEKKYYIMVIALKKKVLLLIVVVISFVSIFELIKSKKTDEIDIQVFFVDELNDNKFETLTFCALNRYNDFDLIEVEIPEDINNIYIYVLDRKSVV